MSKLGNFLRLRAGEMSRTRLYFSLLCLTYMIGSAIAGPYLMIFGNTAYFWVVLFGSVVSASTVIVFLYTGTFEIIWRRICTGK